MMSKRVMHHVCIQTEDYEKSLAFYRDVMEFEVVQVSEGFHGRDFNTWLKFGEFMIELQTAKNGESLNKWSSKNEGIVHMCFLVDNIDEEYNRIIDMGYDNFKVKNGEIIYNVEGCKLFKIKAPEGTEIEIRDTNI